jgi:uncharacterized protein YndB with AHSA1/START domain
MFAQMNVAIYATSAHHLKELLMLDSALYSVEREYPHPIEQVWHAWTDAAALESWYHGMEHSVLPGSVICEPEVGGRWSVAVSVPQYDFVAYFYGRYLVVEPMTRLEHSLMYCESAEEFAIRDESVESHRVVIDFEERGNHTWVKYSQFGELPEGEEVRAQAGIESYFDSLGAYLG